MKALLPYCTPNSATSGVVSTLIPGPIVVETVIDLM
jgi:hypothetical protein